MVFLPLLVGVIGLFYNAETIWPWAVSAVGVVVLFVEILSRMQFFFNLKLSHLLIMLLSFAAGVGLILRSLQSSKDVDQRPPWQDAIDQLNKS